MFRILGLQFNLYGLLIGLGIWGAYEMSSWLAKKRKVSTKLVDKMLWWVLIPGVIGARLYHVVDLWGEIYSFAPVSALYIWEGGLGIWGALLGGILGLITFVWWAKKSESKVNFLELLDLAMIGMPLAQAIGRWGNFVNDELWGKNDEPLFLYESVLNMVLFAVLVFLAKRKQKAGVLSGVYFVGYGVIRFLLEPLRPDEIIWAWNGIAWAQIWAVIAIVSGGFLYFRTILRTSSR